MITSQLPKLLCPTLHFYHYVLRNGLNDSDEQLKARRDYFTKNLYEITSHLTSKKGENAGGFVRLISPEQDWSPSGSLLDLTLEAIPDDCKRTNSDRLYLQTGTSTSRIGVWRLNDTYLLRFTRYISSAEGQQSLKTFGDLGDHLCNLPIELGQTAILAGIIPQNEYQDNPSIDIAAECLSQYCGEDPKLISPRLIDTNFLGSPFYLYPKSVKAKTLNDFPVQSTHLMGVILYPNVEAEKKANKFYNVLQDMLLSYHKIDFFYSQSLALKKLVGQQYKEIEQLTEDYANTNWNKESLKKLPHDSLEYYKKLSFLSDQKETIRVNLHNYRGCLKQIEEDKDIGEKLEGFLANFVNDAEHYLEQIQTTIGFMSPGLKLYDKLMLSVQTQVSIDDERIQKKQSDQQQKLGQLLTGSCAAIAVGQILTPAITLSVSQYYIDKDPSQPPSVTSLWVGGFLTIILSLLSGWVVSQLVYRWFTQPESDETTQRRSG
ncbi:hypothetical protein J0895_19330 [Phormidium pseudopriestleyi FRX01]|uniref:Uncharacterized protein n=1 Tax=Phormidium pseudopriestleyi FRX01 TaxID=1759528 RepID=A0ABS3FVS1_9CYAN|nr:hypothetical protein [Phormidium pseudopriestleyi]MBO0351186.1 hypothetical protein [Phormidium pseudopriestleyi FRX01]